MHVVQLQIDTGATIPKQDVRSYTFCSEVRSGKAVEGRRNNLSFTMDRRFTWFFIILCLGLLADLKYGEKATFIIPQGLL